MAAPTIINFNNDITLAALKGGRQQFAPQPYLRFLCPLCSASFNRPDNVQRHVMVDTDHHGVARHDEQERAYVTNTKHRFIYGTIGVLAMGKEMSAVWWIQERARYEWLYRLHPVLEEIRERNQSE